MQYANLILAIINVYAISKRILIDKKVIGVIVAVNLFVVCTTLIGVVLLLVNLYSMLAVQAILLLLSIMAGLFRISLKFHSLSVCITKRNLFFFTAFLILMTAFVFQRCEYFEQTGDAGIYTNYAIALNNGGQQTFSDNVAKKLSPDLQLAYYQNNYIPGLYMDGESNTYYYQFYKAWPVAMANFGAIFGQNQVQHLTVLLFILLTTDLYLYIQSFPGNRLNAGIAAILLISSPLVVYFAKYPTSEFFLVYLAAISIFSLGFRTKTGYCTAGTVFVLMAFTHIQNFFYLPILFFMAIYAYIKENRDLLIPAGMGFMGIALSIPYGFAVSRQYTIDIMNTSFGSVSLGVCALAGASVLGLSVCIAGKAIHGAKVIRRIIDRFNKPSVYASIARIAVVLLIAATAVRAYQLGWTDQYLPDIYDQNSNWSIYRGEYAGAGLVSLLHLNVVSVCFASALIALPIVLIVYSISKKIHENEMASFAFFSLVIQLMVYTVIRPDTTINYYASRYFLPIVLPNLAICLYYALNHLQSHRLVLNRFLILTVSLIIACFNLPYNIFMMTHQDYGGRLDFIRAVSDLIPEESVVFIQSDMGKYLLSNYLRITKRSVVVVALPQDGGLAQMREYCEELGCSGGYLITQKQPENAYTGVVRVELHAKDYIDSIWYPARTAENIFVYYVYCLEAKDIPLLLEQQ